MEIDNFDLLTLIKQDDLNIRYAAGTEPLLTVDEYFGMLTKLLKLAPDVKRGLIKFASRDGDMDAIRSLDSMITLLEDMRYDRFIVDFHAIIDAYRQGNWRLAATHTQRVSEDFNRFCSRISLAKEKAQSLDAALREKYNDPDGKLSLKEFIGLIDEEKAGRHVDGEEADRKADEEKDDSKPLILAVDDSPSILKSVESVLSNDYQVLMLVKPAMLEKILRQKTPDLFLLDYNMPELNGFELVPIIKSFEEHKETPIIFLTSEGTIDNVTAALALGASDFVVKPFIPNVLREKIKKHISRK